jgi:ribosomal protein S18 acetylase RimI-like enzyme
MDEVARAFALMDRIDEGIAERVESTLHGELIVDTRLHHVHDRNFVRVADPGDVRAEELAREAEEAHGRYPVIRHRRVNLRDEETSSRLEPGFTALGWEPQRFVLMALGRDPDKRATAGVREADEATLRPLWAEAIRRFPHGKDEEVVRQILEHRRLLAEAIPTRFFAVEADGKLVAHAELYSLDGVGQVEDVVTLDEYRGRGFARALVLHAVAESRAVGNDLTFLVADADDWPQELYEKLGFDVVGRYARFLRKP